jgi:hypothetical protein
LPKPVNIRIRKLITRLLFGVLVIGFSLIPVNGESDSSIVRAKPPAKGPVVESVTLIESTLDAEVTMMTPLSPYRVKVVASDVDTIDDIRQIEFHIYHSSDGITWDADELAVYVWDKTAGWSMGNGSATTTWELLVADCIAPADYGSGTGEWYLAFKPGKLARADAARNWFCSATASDAKKSGSGTWTTGASMAVYSEMAFDASALTFGDAAQGILPGSVGFITTPATGYLTIWVIGNAQYSLGVSSEAAWSDGGSNLLTLSGLTGMPPGIAELSLEIDNGEAGGGLPGQPKNPQAVTDTDTTIAGYDAVPRCTTGAGNSESVNAHVIYMGMWLSVSGIQEVVYSGTITFTLLN